MVSGRKMADGEKPDPLNSDVDALFQKVGAKLGWFQFKDVDSALNSITESAKKKAPKSRILKESSGRKTNSSRSKLKPQNTGSRNLSWKDKSKGDQFLCSGSSGKRNVRSSKAEAGKLREDSCTSPDSGDGLPAESTRIGSCVFRTDSSSFVNLSLSPVSFATSTMNYSALGDSYEALSIRRKSKGINHSDLDVTDKKYATCYPDDDDIFYSVLDPENITSAGETADKVVDLTSPVSVKSSDHSDYVEVDDKAVSTGSLELEHMSLLDVPGTEYEQNRTYFAAWSLGGKDTSLGAESHYSENIAKSAVKKLSGLGNTCSDDRENETKKSTNSEASGNTSGEDRIVLEGSGESSGELCEVEDKCVGTEMPDPTSDTNLNLKTADSPVNSVNTTRYFDTEEPLTGKERQQTSSRRSSIADKSVYYDVSDITLPPTVSHQRNTGRNLTCSVADDSLPDIDVPADKVTQGEVNSSVSTQPWRRYSTDSSDDDLENFFTEMRTPLRERLKTNSVSNVDSKGSLDDFIVDDDDVTSDEDERENNSGFFHVNIDRKVKPPVTGNSKPNNTSARQRRIIEILDSDSDEENFAPPKAKPSPKPVFKTPKPVTNTGKATPKAHSSVKPPAGLTEKPERATFLSSLSSSVPDHRKHPDAPRYLKQFSRVREELVRKLFVLYNTTVFDSKMPSDLPIKWNCRLLKTAGYCRYKRKRVAGVPKPHSVEIELSTKVLDSAERVRDTLIHELCHAAVWLFNETNDGHGPYWKYWARKSNIVHPELPVISRCHNYSIQTKYTYKCAQCGYQIGRHSKSLDTSRKVCGKCHGRFELMVSGKDGPGSTPKTPRTPSKFALFVKENYNSIKQSNADYKHKDVMAALSREFAEKNRIKDSL